MYNILILCSALKFLLGLMTNLSLYYPGEAYRRKIINQWHMFMAIKRGQIQKYTNIPSTLFPRIAMLNSQLTLDLQI